jgi:uncharacterized protein YjbI with pentapeptide repeats
MSIQKNSGDLLSWLGLSNPPNWLESRPLGHLIGFIITIVVVCSPMLFLASFSAAFAVMFQTIKIAMSERATGINLGVGALIGALLGAPFLVWATVLKYQTVRYQKEGQITDRINKAVEQLGVEKSVETIGRPVTLWTGPPERITYKSAAAPKLDTNRRRKVFPIEWREEYNPDTDEVEEQAYQSIWTWPKERTVIQWQGVQVDLEHEEEVGVEGDWTVFRVTEPNLEVRIGSILSLERIAQDTTLYDNGRDHVLIMEILCAYVKENAPIRDTKARPSGIISTDDVQDARIWAANSPNLRADIQMALNVIGRRSDEQVKIERSHKSGDHHYKLDLSFVDIRRARLAGLNFSGALLHGSWLDGSDLKGTNFQGANLFESGFVGVKASKSHFQGANFSADFSGAWLNQATFEFYETDDSEAVFSSRHGRRSNFGGAQLIDATLVFSGDPTVGHIWSIGANFTEAQMRGCLFDGYSSFYSQKWPQFFHHGNKDEKGLAFRNCQLNNDIVSRCALDHCFGDGTVILADGSGPSSAKWPQHWPKDKLIDADFMRQLKEWRQNN